MVHRNWRVFDTIVRIIVGTFLLVSAACVALGQSPVPLINQPLVPDAAKPGGASFTLTVNGSGFMAGSVVHWNGTARTTTFVSHSQLKASIMAADIAKPGTASVTVVSPRPGVGTSNVAPFEVTWPGPSVGLARADYATGSASDAVVVGDFNRDGKLDIAVANSGNSTVGVFLGNGDGTFQAQVDYPAPGFLNGMAAGDFNADGKLDLVTVTDIGEAWILIGNGDGTFQAATFASYTGSDATSAAVGDFNGDGKLDLVVTDATSGVSILLGNGDGTFQSPRYDYLPDPPTSVAVGDFNGDGKLDLVLVMPGPDFVSVLLGNGDGTFQLPIEYQVDFAAFVATGDFNGDGKLDLVVANAGSTPRVNVLLGAGDGTFAYPVPYAVGANPKTIAIGDFNGDNKLDLAVADSGSNTASVLLGNGDGTFQAHVDFPTGSNPVSVAVGDFNRIGRPDLAVAALDVVSVLYQTTVTPTSLTFASQLLGTSSAAQSVTLTDFGTTALSIGSIGFTGAEPGDFHQTNNCGSSLAAGANCTIGVTFPPTAINARTANLSITDNALGSPQIVALTGNGTEVELNPASFSFGVVQANTSKRESATLTNVGKTTLSISAIAVTGTMFSQTNTCGSNVGAGNSCTITVNFRPTGKGTFSGTLSVSDNGGGGVQQVALSGSGCVYNGHKCATAIVALPVVRSALAARNTVTVPRSTGSSPVGTLMMALTDSTRKDPFLADGSKRELLVRFWYPASDSENCTAADYTSPRVWSYFTSLTGLPLPAVTTNSCLNATVLDGVHPVVVFTPGYTGTFTDYTFLFEDLASRGYVVASIDHTYEATAVEFPDGRFVKSVLGSHLDDSWQTDDATINRALSVRLDDLKFVMDELEPLNVSGDNPLAGKLDLTRVALAGHSFGGLTTWLDLQRVSRFKAAVLLDPYLADIGSDITETPVLLMTMGRDKPSQNECRLWSNLHGPRSWVNLRGTEHATPSDAVWLAKGAILTGSMGPEKTMDALRRYIAAFLGSTLRGEPPDVLLEGSSPEFPEVAVTPQDQPVCRQP